MRRLEADLDPNRLVLIHRSTIVNIHQIQEFQLSFNRQFVVALRGGTHLTLSRGYRDGLQARLGTPL
jgi:two-component system, LytTR family, response regulator